MVHSSFGNSEWETESCRVLAAESGSFRINRKYLESTADAEYAVVGLLGRQALEGELDNVVLFG